MSSTEESKPVVEAFKDDPVAAEGHVPSDPQPQPVVEAFKDDPISATPEGVTTEEKVGTEEVKVTAKPVTEGTLGYKAPGLVNKFRFSQRHFWLGDEAVSVQDLNQYLKGEKAELSHPNAAWSSQTGKGLLFFVKRQEDKKTPAGVINLSEASEVTKESTAEFSFKVHNQKHTFQAANADERNGWIVTIESTIESARASREEITGSSGYKENMTQLSKPSNTTAVAGASAATAAAGGAVAATAATNGEQKHEATVADGEQPKSQSKNRSASRNKRSSVFGSLLGKKDDQEEQKELTPEEKEKEEKEKADEKAKKEAEAKKKEAERKEKAHKKEQERAEERAKKEDAERKRAQEKADKKAKEEAEKKAAKEEAEKKAEVHDDKKVEAAEVAAGAGVAAAGAGAVAATTQVNGTEASTEESKTEETATTDANATSKSTKTSKRTSIFGSMFQKSSEKKEETTKEEVKTTEAPATTEPVVVVAAAEGPTEEFKTPPTETPPTLNGETIANGSATATKTETTVDSSATATKTETTEKRRSSFFGLGGIKKEKKTETPATTEAIESPTGATTTATAEAVTEPTTNGTTTKSSESPKAKSSGSSKFSELLRRPSKAVKNLTHKDKETSTTTPETVKEIPADAKPDIGDNGELGIDKNTEAIANTTKLEPIAAENGAPTEEKTNGHVIGDVVPEAVQTGHASPPTVSATA